MKKLTLILFLFLFLCQIVKAQQVAEPLYLMFDTNTTLTTAKLSKHINVRTSNDAFHTVIYQDSFNFIPKYIDGMTNFLYTHLYGGSLLGLITLDKNNPMILTQAQLASYNIKTHDELAEYFRLTPIKKADQKQYFWEREVYIIEKIYGKNNNVWYHKYKVEPDRLYN